MNFNEIKVYGYGTLAITIVCGLSLLGIVLLPCIKKKVYDKILIILTGLAIGSIQIILEIYSVIYNSINYLSIN